jgi:hypothetical protein
MSRNIGSTLPGTFAGIIKSPHPREPEKAQIAVEESDHGIREIRINNRLKNENGNDVRLKLGERVEMTVEAKAVKKATTF